VGGVEKDRQQHQQHAEKDSLDHVSIRLHMYLAMSVRV
jgi:hypothetical protein